MLNHIKSIALIALLFLLCPSSISQNTLPVKDSADFNKTSPLIPQNKENENSFGVIAKRLFLPRWWRYPLDSLGRRMILAESVLPDTLPFKPRYIHTRNGFHRYEFLINAMSLLIKYKYDKDCGKKTIIKDCRWREIEIPYRFIDSIRGIEFAPGFLIHYKDLMLQNAKFKILISIKEVDMLARMIIARLKADKKPIDSSFAFIYHGSWQSRVAKKIAELKRGGVFQTVKKNNRKNKKYGGQSVQSFLNKDEMISRQKKKQSGSKKPLKNSSSKSEKRNSTENKSSGNKKKKSQKIEKTDDKNESTKSTNKKQTKPDQQTSKEKSKIDWNKKIEKANDKTELPKETQTPRRRGKPN